MHTILLQYSVTMSIDGHCVICKDSTDPLALVTLSLTDYSALRKYVELNTTLGEEILADLAKIRQIKFPPKFRFFRRPPNYIPTKFKDFRHPPNFIPA